MVVTRDLLQEWDRRVASPTDTAAPGRRADDEVARRCLAVEIARIQGCVAVLVLRDARQFFDRLTVLESISVFKELHFPSARRLSL